MAMDAPVRPAIVFVLGGSRSGKSRVALDLAPADAKVVFFATGVASDAEMRERIERHRLSRPVHWHLVEEAVDLTTAMQKIKSFAPEIVVFDSLTTWAGNVLHRGLDTAAAMGQLRAFLQEAPRFISQMILVSDEVGQGLVPDSEMARLFRDFLGDANQAVAAAAQRVHWVCAGISMVIKG